MPEFTPQQKPEKPPLFRPELRRRGIFILPSLFTTGALFSGFFAIVLAQHSRFELAAIAIFVSMVLDGLDGRVARLTNTQSAFGAEYDSLADMVSFGVAPAFLAYTWALSGLGRLGWIAAFIYCAGAALRLARFNTNIGVIDKRYFQGLPSPAAAALIAGFVWVMKDFEIPTEALLNWLAAGITLFAGISMVTNLRFYSFKTFNLKKPISFFWLLLLALLVLSVFSHPVVPFGFFCCYALSGYVMAFVKKK